MMSIYILSYLFVRYVLHYGEGELKGKYKSVMLGLGTYVFVWAASWVLLYTLFPY